MIDEFMLNPDAELFNISISRTNKPPLSIVFTIYCPRENLPSTKYVWNYSYEEALAMIHDEETKLKFQMEIIDEAMIYTGTETGPVLRDFIKTFSKEAQLYYIAQGGTL